MTYKQFFANAFGKEADNHFAPFEYQSQMAKGSWPDLLDVPTGMGKTAAVTLAWLWKRGWRNGIRPIAPDAGTPRRLVYCLPMRALVEQTAQDMSKWLQRLNIAGTPGQGRVSIHVLMGGADGMKTWAEHPEEDMILVGTQDMLLSRALMRGYGLSRYVWPVHFGLLHSDALWVFDEVQLMGVGLTTSAQLEAFRRTFPAGKPCRSLWLSATLNPQWLATVDMGPYCATLKRHSINKKDRQQARARLSALKSVKRATLKVSSDTDAYLEALCNLVLTKHESGSQTLVILNRVDRAQQLYRLLRARRPGSRDLLIHARFRPYDRSERARSLRDEPDVDRILVVTQAVEAGLDISSKTLVTELAPWSSLVQRFGRCNRYGEHNRAGGAQIVWIDIPEAAADVMLPYRADDLVTARRHLKSLKNAMPGKLPRVEEERAATAVLRRKDLLDLFNTDPDLSGFDVDVSDYIRDIDTPGVQVFWRAFERDPQRPTPLADPQRAELCPISIGQAKGLQKRGAWYWDSLDGEWRKLVREPRPGMTLLMRASDGAYNAQIGFDATLKEPVPVIANDRDRPTEVAFSEDSRSKTPFPVSLSDHLTHVARHARALCAAVDEKKNANEVVRAGRWHDVGKAHPIFQSSMHSCDRAPRNILAKSPCAARYERKFFRHEVASMLAWLAQNGDEAHSDLVAYLQLSHHGKVRMSLRAMPSEAPAPDGRRFARGVWEGDTLPAFEFDGERTAEIALNLEMMEIGDSAHGQSWSARALKLLHELGPFRLAWLESLVRLADWRASAEEQVRLKASTR